MPSDEVADNQTMHGKYGHAHQARTVDPRLIRSTGVVAVLAVLHIFVVSTLSIIHHRNFGTYAFDFGIYDVGQYTAFMVPGLIVGTIDVVARVKRRSSPKRPMFKVVVAWLCFCSLFGAYARTPLPGSMAFRYWKLQPPRNASALRQALALIPKDASVTASADLVTHLSHRRNIYVYPNPFVREKYGLEAKPPYTRSPFVPVEPKWVILNGDRWVSDATTITLRTNRRWAVVYEKDGVAVFRSATS